MSSTPQVDRAVAALIADFHDRFDHDETTHDGPPPVPLAAVAPAPLSFYTNEELIAELARRVGPSRTICGAVTITSREPLWTCRREPGHRGAHRPTK